MTTLSATSCSNTSPDAMLFAGDPTTILIESEDGRQMGCIQTQGELDALVAALNRKGTRERVLLNVLRRKYRAIADAFEEGAYANLAEVDRSVQWAWQWHCRRLWRPE